MRSPRQRFPGLAKPVRRRRGLRGKHRRVADHFLRRAVGDRRPPGSITTRPARGNQLDVVRSEHHRAAAAARASMVDNLAFESVSRPRVGSSSNNTGAPERRSTPPQPADAAPPTGHVVLAHGEIIRVRRGFLLRWFIVVVQASLTSSADGLLNNTLRVTEDQREFVPGSGSLPAAITPPDEGA